MKPATMWIGLGLGTAALVWYFAAQAKSANDQPMWFDYHSGQYIVDALEDGTFGFRATTKGGARVTRVGIKSRVQADADAKTWIDANTPIV